MAEIARWAELGEKNLFRALFDKGKQRLSPYTKRSTLLAAL